MPPHVRDRKSPQSRIRDSWSEALPRWTVIDGEVRIVFTFLDATRNKSLEFGARSQAAVPWVAGHRRRRNVSYVIFVLKAPFQFKRPDFNGRALLPGTICGRTGRGIVREMAVQLNTR